jgi:hypothetical protein
MNDKWCVGEERGRKGRDREEGMDEKSRGGEE